MPDDLAERIKRLTIISLMSDDELMETLVLKGGNAIRLLQDQPVRQSLDIDFSMEGDFEDGVEEMQTRMQRLLIETFGEENFVVFDVRLMKAPPMILNDTVGDFWGGYTLEFKVLDRQTYDQLAISPDHRRRQAIEVRAGGNRTFSVDFSKREYCKGKTAVDVEGFTVYVYTPLMIVCEKIRAICQQMELYRRIVESRSQKPRARDFFDIHNLMTNEGVVISDDESWEVLRNVFAAKRVPMSLLGRISEEREFHRENFVSVRDTVGTGYDLKPFDFYVDFLIDQLTPLQSRWEE